MRIWFDTEFIEDGKTIELISIGMVREDGSELYMENGECDLTRANDWVRENVVAKLESTRGIRANLASRKTIAEAVQRFAGNRPEFWAYYADYDWVVLCQMYGRMLDLPSGWPMYCRDLQQEADNYNVKLPAQLHDEHHALHDAVWTKRAHEWLAGFVVASTKGPRHDR